MRHTALGIALLLAVPAFTFAAGFAKQSIFLSQESVTEGDTILIHAVVSNDESVAFAGTLLLRDQSEQVGSVPVSLKAGEATAVSVSWKPLAGKRTISADLTAKDGATVESMSETFTIKEKPKPAATPAQPAAAIDSSDDIQEKIGSVSPAAEAAVAPVFAAIDSGRNAVADVLDKQLKIANAKLGDVQGAQDDRPGELPDTVGGFTLALWTVYFYLLTVVRFLVGNAALFYPVFAILILFLIFRTFRRFRRG